MRNLIGGMLLGVSVLAAACERRKPETSPAASPGASPAATTEAAAEHTHAAEGEGEELLPIMQRLGTSMAALTHGLMTEDSATVATNAAAIAAHAPIAPAELERISQALGDRMAEFERLDAAVHDGSVRLHEAAAAGRTDEVLTRLNEVQRGCVACHTQFRARLRRQ